MCIIVSVSALHHWIAHKQRIEWELWFEWVRENEKSNEKHKKKIFFRYIYIMNSKTDWETD